MSNLNGGRFFGCTMCGNCCKGYGGTYVSRKDIKKLATFLNISYDRFVLNYTIVSGNRLIIAQQENGYCVFWNEDKACLIHPVKPNMCRKWPFIQPVLNDIRNWRIMANLCPGIDALAKESEITTYIRNCIIRG